MATSKKFIFFDVAIKVLTEIMRINFFYRNETKIICQKNYQ